MPGLVKIWWHDGATRDIRYHDIPVVNEPELAFETLAVNATPANTSAAPEDASVAVSRPMSTCAMSCARPVAGPMPSR